jgi:hypothetical protein
MKIMRIAKVRFMNAFQVGRRDRQGLRLAGFLVLKGTAEKAAEKLNRAAKDWLYAGKSVRASLETWETWETCR